MRKINLRHNALSKRLLKCLGVIAIITAFTGTTFADLKSKRNFSTFDDAYPSIWLYEDFSSSSYSSFTDSDDDHGDYNRHNDGRDNDYGNYKRHNGDRNNDYGHYNRHNGDRDNDYAVSLVPEPVSSTLFIIGGAALGFRRFLKKRKVV